MTLLVCFLSTHQIYSINTSILFTQESKVDIYSAFTISFQAKVKASASALKLNDLPTLFIIAYLNTYIS